MIMEVYIARHGETEYNLHGKYQGGGLDSPLTATGISQAEALGRFLEDIDFDAVYSSPLKRAQSTVEIAFKGRCKPILDSRLVEIGLGEMEGMLWSEAGNTYPGSNIFDPLNYTPPPKGESLPDMIERISSFMDDISKTSHKRVFILAHGYVLRVFEACVMGKTVEALSKARGYKNCEVAQYRFMNGNWENV